MAGRPRTLSTPAESPLSAEFDERTFRSAAPAASPPGSSSSRWGPGALPRHDRQCLHVRLAGAALVVVSVGLKARMHDRITPGRRFGVSILETEQEAESRHFAGQPVARFAPGSRSWRACPSSRARQWCWRHGSCIRHTCGDHTLVVGEVEHLEVDTFPSPPLVFYNGRYRELQPVVDAPGRSPEIFSVILLRRNEEVPHGRSVQHPMSWSTRLPRRSVLATPAPPRPPPASARRCISPPSPRDPGASRSAMSRPQTGPLAAFGGGGQVRHRRGAEAAEGRARHRQAQAPVAGGGAGQPVQPQPRGEVGAPI